LYCTVRRDVGQSRETLIAFRAGQRGKRWRRLRRFAKPGIALPREADVEAEDLCFVSNLVD